jgi:hypothetical protein
MDASASALVKRLYLAASVTLLVGLGLAASIWFTSEDVEDNALVEGFRNSKSFRHDMEVYGGKMGLLGDQLNRWFTGLWQGRQLGITVGCISVTIALLLFILAWLNRDEASDQEAGKDS